MFSPTKKLLISGNIDTRTLPTAQPTTKLKYKGKWLLIAAIVLVLTPICLRLLNSEKNTTYHYPLHLAPELAASFGEIRADHFHMGLDLRTRGKENIPVYAVADGYISRVQVMEKGYGKAVFITHTNGTTSVYAHLNRFNDELEKLVHARQYAQQQREQDILLTAAQYPILKGSLVALSGNTGSSEGPHLHFELRNSKTGNQINPQIAGFSIQDDVPPTIKHLYWYNKKGSIYETKGQLFSIMASSAQQPLKVSEPYIVLGMEVTDKNTNNRYQLGIYKSCLYMDDQLMHQFSMDELSDSTTRFVNGVIDYSEFARNGKVIQLLTTLPGNNLLLYSKAPADGILNLSDKRVHEVSIEVEDISGNKTVQKLYLQYNGKHHDLLPYPPATVFAYPGKANVVQTAGAMIAWGRNTFFDRAPLLITSTPSNQRNAASTSVQIFTDEIPISDSLLIAVACTLHVKDTLRKHTIMQLTNKTTKSYVKGEWKGNFLQGHFTKTGTVQLITDTTAPVIVLENPATTRFSPDDSIIRVLCKEVTDCITFFSATLDGKWVPFEKKGNRFYYEPDGNCNAGVHTLQVTVKDLAGNTSNKSFTIIR